MLIPKCILRIVLFSFIKRINFILFDKKFNFFELVVRSLFKASLFEYRECELPHERALRIFEGAKLYYFHVGKCDSFVVKDFRIYEIVGNDKNCSFGQHNDLFAMKIPAAYPY